MTTNTERELGILRAEVDHIKEDVKEAKTDIKEIGLKVDSILSKLDQQDGAKRMLIMVASTLGGVVGAFISATVALIVKFF